MNFQVTVNGTVAEFEQYQDALRYIDGAMAYWNNFEPDTGLTITVAKVPSDTEIIQVCVGDEFKVGEQIGG